MRISAHLLLVLPRIFLLLIGLASSLDAAAAHAEGLVESPNLADFVELASARASQ
jgi:hypothetical protein